MSTLTESTVIQSIKVVPATGVVEVALELQALRGEEVVHATAVTLTLKPGDAIPEGLDARALAIVAAAWTPEQMDAARDALLARIREDFDKLDSVQTSRAASLEEARRMNDDAEQAVNRTRAAIAAAHQELDVEHATLNERSDAVTSRRAELFARHETIRKQHPELDSLLNEMAEKVKA